MAEIHYNLTNMPEEPIPAGSEVFVSVTEVAPMEDGAISVTLRYEDHTE